MDYPPKPENPSEGLSALLAQIHESPPSPHDSRKIGEEESKALKEKLELDMLREKVRSMTQDIDERKRYAANSFRLVCHWVAAVFVLLVLQGFLSAGLPLKLGDFSMTLTFKLPDSVLLAVVGGTTVSIIGIFLVVANYLFPKH